MVMSEESRSFESVLGSELEGFDRFMTAKRIDGEESDTLTGREFKKVESVLERPLPDRIVQEKLLKQHIKH